MASSSHCLFNVWRSFPTSPCLGYWNSIKHLFEFWYWSSNKLHSMIPKHRRTSLAWKNEMITSQCARAKPSGKNKTKQNKIQNIYKKGVGTGTMSTSSRREQKAWPRYKEKKRRWWITAEYYDCSSISYKEQAPPTWASEEAQEYKTWFCARAEGIPAYSQSWYIAQTSCGYCRILIFFFFWPWWLEGIKSSLFKIPFFQFGSRMLIVAISLFVDGYTCEG